MTPLNNRVAEYMEGLGFVFSKRDGLWHKWVKDSNREIARIAPEAAKPMYLQTIRARLDENNSAETAVYSESQHYEEYFDKAEDHRKKRIAELNQLLEDS
jgi:predicted Ser/Thr protein kinase